MAGEDKADKKYDHDVTPPPSYEEVQMKNVVKTDKKDEKTEDEKEKDEEEKTEELVPPVGMLELVPIFGRQEDQPKCVKPFLFLVQVFHGTGQVSHHIWIANSLQYGSFYAHPLHPFWSGLTGQSRV